MNNPDNKEKKQADLKDQEQDSNKKIIVPHHRDFLSKSFKRRQPLLSSMTIHV